MMAYKFKLNPITGELDLVSDLDTTTGDLRYLMVDQSISGPQTVTGGVPRFDVGLVSLGSGTISYDSENRVSAATRTGGRTITFTRDGYGMISSWTDGTNTWAITRSSNGGRMTAWGVS